MTSCDPDPNLPDDVSIGQVRLPPSIKRALVAAGLKTVGDVRKTSDAMLLSIQNLGQNSVTRLRKELGPNKPSIIKSGNTTPPAIAALETNIIFRHRSETSASSSSCASICEISSIRLSSSVRFKIDIR
jgi:hypothetical protein